MTKRNDIADVTSDQTSFGMVLLNDDDNKDDETEDDDDGGGGGGGSGGGYDWKNLIYRLTTYLKYIC